MSTGSRLVRAKRSREGIQRIRRCLSRGPRPHHPRRRQPGQEPDDRRAPLRVSGCARQRAGRFSRLARLCFAAAFRTTNTKQHSRMLETFCGGSLPSKLLPRSDAAAPAPPPAGNMTRTIAKPTLRLGFFTRLLDQADAAERYRLATAQIMHAERCGFDSAWVAQHHFHEDEGGLPAPFVFLSQIAARTTRIRLGTGIVTLPLELPLRVAEDAAVLDLMCGGRLEIGIGPGGNLSAYEAFGLDSTERTALLVRHHRVLVDAWSGRALPGGDRLYPPNPGLADRIWQATFNIEGARRAGAAGVGLMPSRTQPRPAGKSRLSLPDIQNPMIDAYLASLAPERAPRILASRTVFVADDRAEALRLAEIGLARQRVRYAAIGRPVFVDGMSVHDQIAAMDIHIGDPDDVIGSLRADTVLARATDLTVQSHSIDPPHPFILRSIELVAEVVAPALGWRRTGAAAARHG